MSEKPRCKRESPFYTIWEEGAMGLFNQLRNSQELQDYELAGLAEGAKRGKTPNVSWETLFSSLRKQYDDFVRAYLNFDDNNDELKKCLADIRNVAGIFFLSVSTKRKEEIQNGR